MASRGEERLLQQGSSSCLLNKELGGHKNRWIFYLVFLQTTVVTMHIIAAQIEIYSACYHSIGTPGKLASICSEQSYYKYNECVLRVHAHRLSIMATDDNDEKNIGICDVLQT